MCMVWCEVECERDVEWCTEMWWSDLMWIMVKCDVYVKCGAMWNVAISELRDVECGWNAKCVMWNMACCGMWCPGMWNVVYCKMWKVTMWCEMWWCGIVWCRMWLKCKMCDVEYGVLWNVVSWYVECCILQDVESYDVMWNVMVWNCGDEECGISNGRCCVIVVRCQMWKMMQCVM